jgi:tetratricopeptide (TPR) repeat protein
MRRLVAATIVLAACGPAAISQHKTTPDDKDPPKTIVLEPLRIDAISTDQGVVTRISDARGLLDDGNDALMQRKYDQAILTYGQLIRDFPDSKLVIAALYNTGLAYEGKNEWEKAADQYRDLIARNPPKNHPDLLNSQYRLGAVLAENGHYAESAKVFESVLDRDDLPPADRIEALARLGFALVETKDYVGGEEILRSAIAYYREVSATTRVENDYFVAMAQFYLAEIPREQFEVVPLRYPEQQMVRDLDQKSQLFLLARDRYVKTVEFKNAYWATAAVYQIAFMYKTFWDNWMAVPIPADFNEAEQKEYVKQVNEQPTLRKLLEKSLIWHERNVAMAKDARVHTGWAEQWDKDAVEIRKIMARQQKRDYLTPGPQNVPPPTPAATTPANEQEGRPNFTVPSKVDL